MRDQYESNSGRNIKGTVIAVIGVIVLLGALFMLPQCYEHVDADELLVVQYPSGQLQVFTDPGYKPQWFGTVTHYKRSFQIWFSKNDDQGGEKDDAIQCRFTDGGHGGISGCARVDMPLAQDQIINLHRKFGSEHSMFNDLVKPCLQKSVYMAGTLMTSKESAAEKRPLLLTYIEEMAAKGVYDTQTKDVKVIDPITGESKTQTIVTIVKDEKTGLPIHREESPLGQFGLRLYAMTINNIKYDDVVESQIQAAQKATMQVQVAIANSKRAEQDALTAQKEGEAKAATAKWEQEVKKIAEVTIADKEAAVARIAAEREATVAKIAAEKEKSVAETGASQRLAVADLDLKAAQLKKQATIALAEGEAESRTLTWKANGALQEKLETYKAVNGLWATAFAGYKGQLTPLVVMGGSAGANGNTSAMSFMEILQTKAALDLGLQMNTLQQNTLQQNAAQSK